MSANLMKNLVIRELEGGLVLRRAAPTDANALSAFNARIHSDGGPDHPDEGVATWTRDLLEKPHPTFQPGDFTIVEDTSTGEIVSSLNLISQTWMYDGIPFKVGRPELVGTKPEYRQRGLVRLQFEEIHKWSAARGEMVQGITGIPFYYRQFGYEMALNLGGSRLGYKAHLPKLKEDEPEPYLIRQAQESDLAFIQSLYERACARYLVACVRDEAVWRYELLGMSERNVNRSELRIIETPAGEAVGYLAHPIMTWGPTMAVTEFELRPGIPWAAATPSVIRYIYHTGEAYAARDGKDAEFGGFRLRFGSEHPAYQALPSLYPQTYKPYAWYIRLPDLAGFIKHIAPALEKKLAGSPFAGYSGEIKITFYRSGLRSVFEGGLLTQAESWTPEPQGHSGDIAFPGLTFLQLIFGYHSLEELQAAFPDCWTSKDEAGGVLQALFPKRASSVWMLS